MIRAIMADLRALADQPFEFALEAARTHARPDALEVDVVFTDPSRVEWRMPAFWAGGTTWRVRFRARAAGAWRWRSVCAETADAGLHARSGAVDVAAAPIGPGRIVVADDGLRREDGSSFFWLGDTWWMCLAKRMDRDGFHRLAADRAAKGFTLVQIVVGPHPDQPAFDPRSASEAGHSWDADFAALRPAYFDLADARIRHLVGVGLTPCILGMWGYHLPWMGVERVRRHWRAIVARWSAYQPVWCLAGETLMPWYLATQDERPALVAQQKAGWSEVGRAVRAMDPLRNPITTHPAGYGDARDQVDDGVLDFVMLQAGQGGADQYGPSAKHVVDAVARVPKRVVVQGEVCYEASMELARGEAQRFLFWSSLLAGARGYTYGADGIFSANTPSEIFGASAFGTAWGDTPWEEAMGFAASRHLGIGRAVLERFAWRRFVPHNDWINHAAGGERWHAAYCAGIAREARLAYFAFPIGPWHQPATFRALEPGVAYDAAWIDVRDGTEHPLGRITGDANGEWKAPLAPVMRDWLLALRAAR